MRWRYRRGEASRLSAIGTSASAGSARRSLHVMACAGAPSTTCSAGDERDLGGRPAPAMTAFTGSADPEAMDAGPAVAPRFRNSSWRAKARHPRLLNTSTARMPVCLAGGCTSSRTGRMASCTPVSRATSSDVVMSTDRHNRWIYQAPPSSPAGVLERHEDIVSAIRRETNIKGWPRAWKIRLIREVNPDWDD